MYKLSLDPNTIIRIVDNAFIPVDLANRDYQEYQEWLNTGNTIQPADIINIPPSTEPDILKFQTDVSTALGGIVAANELAKAYPLFSVTINNRNWTDLSALITHALESAAISIDQYNAIRAIAAANNIPI